MEELSRPEVIYTGKFLRMVKEGRWEYADRVNSNGAVMIIGVTPGRELIMVEEYRIPLHAHTIGLPAGISGDEGEESLLATAKRELREETGYEAETWICLGDGPSSPGLTGEVITFFLSDGLHQVSDGGGVEGENIRVHKIPLDRIHSWLSGEKKSGKAIDPRIYMALYFVQRHEQGLDL